MAAQPQPFVVVGELFDKFLKLLPFFPQGSPDDALHGVEPLIVKEEGEDDVDAPGVVQPDQNPEDFTHLPDSDFPPARPSIEKIPPPDELNYSTLPDEVWLNVFFELDCEDVVSAGMCCRHWNSLSKDTALWMKLWKTEWPFDKVPNIRRLRHSSSGRGKSMSSVTSSRMSTALYELFVQRKFHELDMSMRRYKELEKALVNDMKFVHTLQIKDQMLRALPNSIAGLPLSSLSLIYTKFRHFPVVLTQIPTLRELNMGFNLIKNLPREIGRLTNLTKLCFNNNLLEELPEELGELEKLQVLDVFYNKIREIPAAIGRLTRLESLSAQSNCLEAIPTSIGKCTHLQVIELSENAIHEVPKEVESLRNLRQLSLASNQLTSLPDIFHKLTALRELNFFGNHLSTLPKTLEAFVAQPESFCLVFMGDNPVDDPLIQSAVTVHNKRIMDRQREQTRLDIAI